MRTAERTMRLRVRTALNHARAQGVALDGKRERVALEDDTSRVTRMNQLPDICLPDIREGITRTRIALVCFRVFGQTLLRLAFAVGGNP